MRYEIKKVWLVIFRTSSNEHVLTFDTRYVANQLFLTIVEHITKLFLNETIISSNLDGDRNDAYYGLVDKLIEVRLIGQDIYKYPVSTIIQQYKNELEEEKNYAI